MPVWKQLQAVCPALFPLSCSMGPLVWPNCMATKTLGGFPLSQLCLCRFPASSVLSRAMAEGMMEWRPLKILCSAKTMRTVAKISRIDFFRTQKINQRLAATGECLLEKKKTKQTLSQNSELYGAVTYQILIPSSIVALKTSSLQSQWKPVAWTPFPHLAGCQEDPTRKTCLYLTWLGVYLVQSSLPSRRSWNRSGTLSSQSCHYCMECLGPVIQTSPPPLPTLSLLQVLVQMSPSRWGWHTLVSPWPHYCNATRPTGTSHFPFLLHFPPEHLPASNVLCISFTYYINHISSQ